MKKIWIWNHYATEMYKNQGGRHYWFAKNLNSLGYDTTVFCANTYHNSKDFIEIKKDKHSTDKINGITFVFVKTTVALGNGFDRVKNMALFFKNLFFVSKKVAKKSGKPDVIIASSVHPLTLVAGIRVARKMKVPCICEVRDLWPESIVAYHKYTKKNLIIKLLYIGERRIYKNADALIFTMEGGLDYLISQNWIGHSRTKINPKKVFHINNGIDIKEFDRRINLYKFYDEDLDSKKFKVVYAGSIRIANNVKKIILTAEIVNKISSNVVFIIYGQGNEVENLQKYVIDNNVSNVIFKGKVDKSYIPYILSKSSLNILHFKKSSLISYGASPNKMFDYFASGKPLLSDCELKYDLIQRYSAGIVLDQAEPSDWADAILRFESMPQEEYKIYCDNSRKASLDFDFKILTDKLVNIINFVDLEKGK